MTPPAWLRWLAFGLAPLALLIGVGIQRYNVVANNQTPWAGGGFGMFSTVDIGDGRPFRAYVLTDGGPALVLDASVGEARRLVYTQPTPERVARAARTLAAQDWVVFDSSSYAAMMPALPPDFQAFLAGPAVTPGRGLTA